MSTFRVNVTATVETPVPWLMPGELENVVRNVLNDALTGPGSMVPPSATVTIEMVEAVEVTICPTCQVREHDACPLTPGCSCCEDTMERQ